MSGVGLVFLALGISDLLCGGLAGIPQNTDRCLIGLLSGTLGALIIAAVFGYDSVQMAGLGLCCLLVIAPWLWLRRHETQPTADRPAHADNKDQRRVANAWWALGLLLISLLLTIASAGLWSTPPPPWLQQWLSALPYPLAQSLTAEQLILGLGIGSYLLATSNAIVRTVLIAADPRMAASSQRLRGGRLIGVIERLLIFAMVVAGQPTAAAIITSAKSILRFPELNRVSRAPSPPTDQTGQHAFDQVDAITEYFLLGSLTSWLAALAPTLLF